MWQRDGPPHGIGYWLTLVGTLVFAAGLVAVFFLTVRTDRVRESPVEGPALAVTPTARPTSAPERAQPTAAAPAATTVPSLPRAALGSPSGARLSRNQNTIAGFADVTSAAPGQQVTLYVTTPTASFQVEVYRVGWYDGGSSFATLVDRFAPALGIVQPQPTQEADSGLISAANWAPNANFSVPDSWPTGLYLLKLLAADGDQSYIPLVVRDDHAQHDFLLVHTSSTDQAYNGWGGKSLYEFNSSGDKTVGGTAAAVKVSFDRPFDQDGSGGSLRWELNMVRWLEANHFDVGYISDIDLDRDGQFAARARAVIMAGHSEYWSKEMRDNLELAHTQGKGLGFFSGDTGAWAVRFEDSQLGPDRVEVGYKTASDPLAQSDPAHSTGHWRDAPLNRPTQGFFGLGTGTGIRRSGSWRVSGADVVPDLFAGTGLRNGDAIANLVGYEYDGLWTPGAGQTIPGGLVVIGVSRVLPTVKPDELLNVSAERTLPVSLRPPVGTLSDVIETNADSPYWQLLVRLRAGSRNRYLVYAAGDATDAPRRRQVAGEEYGSFSAGDAFFDPGWHAFERDLRADYISVFDTTPDADDVRVESVRLRGSLSAGPITLNAPGLEPVRLGIDRAITANQDGWRIVGGSGQLGEKLDGRDGQRVLTLDVDVPGERRSDDAHTVFARRGSGGAIAAVGSIQWSWGLNGLDVFGRHADHAGNLTPVDVRVQTLTANLLRALLSAN